MSEVRLVLSSEDYVTLYSQLAERKLLAYLYDETYTRLVRIGETGNEWDEVPVYVEDAQGNTSFSDWAQDEFDDECGIIENFLAETGIVQEEL
jgi:hypothetical protein